MTFISGMARGVDIWASEIVLDLREDNSDIHLICTPPYNGFEKRWGLSEQKLYMVNHSKRVISAYNGSSGGTRNTIEYASRKGIYLIITLYILFTVVIAS